MLALPAILRQRCRTREEIGERRGVSGRCLGALARDQVELSQFLTFVSRRDEGRAAVELVDDLEDDLLALVLWRVRYEQSPDSEVCVGARPFRDERVSSFLDAVVHEPVGVIQALDQLQADRLPQVRVDLFLRGPARARAWSG